MKQFINWLASKNFILIDVILIASIGILLYASWPSLQSYSRWTALALLAIMVLLAVIGSGALVIQVVFLTKRKAIDLRVYEQQQLSLPLSSLSATKISEEREISATVPQTFLRRNRHHLQRLRPAKIRVENITPPANLQSAHLQKSFAPGYRPPSNAVAKPQAANLQRENAPVTDETDAKIVAAAKELRAQNLKVTGIAIAQMTGIAQRTVYDRLDKIKDRVMNQ